MLLLPLYRRPVQIQIAQLARENVKRRIVYIDLATADFLVTAPPLPHQNTLSCLGGSKPTDEIPHS